jgi:hypothetical protein
MMLASGFTDQMLARLIIDGLATVAPESIRASGRRIEIARLQVTEAGRRTLTKPEKWNRRAQRDGDTERRRWRRRVRGAHAGSRRMLMAGGRQKIICQKDVSNLFEAKMDPILTALECGYPEQFSTFCVLAVMSTGGSYAPLPSSKASMTRLHAACWLSLISPRYKTGRCTTRPPAQRRLSTMLQ